MSHPEHRGFWSPAASAAAAIDQLDRRVVGIRLRDLGEAADGWLIHGGAVDEVNAAAWNVYEDTARIEGANAAATAVAGNRPS